MRHSPCHAVVLGVLVIVACTDGRPDPLTSPETRHVDPDGAGSADREPGDRRRTPRAGGALTIFDTTGEAFSFPAPGLDAEALALHDEGDEAFEDAFVETPGADRSGLGPVFDNVSCEACHNGDGRGRPPASGESFESLLFRISIPGRGAHGAPNAAPGFGGQLQLRAITGLTPEASAAITYTESPGTFADGSPYSLRVPYYAFSNSYTMLPTDLLASPRVAPAVFGLGLLEAVPDYEMRARADPFDRDGDGISGRVNIVWDELHQRRALGRFGWKASVPTLLQQSAGAYNGDMGITSFLFPAESCEEYFAECAPHDVEVSEETIRAVAFYMQTLGVPARRDVRDPEVRQGEALFGEIGCKGCHTPTLFTGFLPGVPQVSAQVIHPYTDLLLHDMGPGLADGRSDFGASGREWRTAPLWGIGLVERVNGHTNFMHDGRARSLLEAVLWHDGEAERSRDAVLRMSASQRSALIRFLQSL